VDGHMQQVINITIINKMLRIVVVEDIDCNKIERYKREQSVHDDIDCNKIERYKREQSVHDDIDM
jgi:hypothetical protein